MDPKPRVRFAPSPTGFLHIGGVRTALFNYLFARREKGIFLLRIEDTDRERSKKEFEDEILDSLKWLGLDWDEAILRQGERLPIYREAAKRLLESGSAYESESAVKFKIPKKIIKFQDLVHGAIEFDGTLLDDLVIQKSDGFPTYHFACVVDDHEMGITHVIRGDDHISNTPRQIFLYEALGWKPPQFAHLPLVFAADKTPLSKRHGAVSLSAYRKEGYLPEGILNYLALLGWAAGGNQEVFSRDELIQKFDLTKVNKTNACFDPEKFKWMNAEHIRRLSDQDYIQRLGDFLAGEGEKLPHSFSQIARLYKDRIRVFREFREQAGFFFSAKGGSASGGEEEINFDSQAVAKYLKAGEIIRYLDEWKKTLDREGDFSDPKNLESLLRKTAECLGVEAKILIHATRVALSGRSVTPGLFEVMAALGKELVLRRISYVIINHKNLT